MRIKPCYFLGNSRLYLSRDEEEISSSMQPLEGGAYDLPSLETLNSRGKLFSADCLVSIARSSKCLRSLSVDDDIMAQMKPTELCAEGEAFPLRYLFPF